MSQLQYKRKCSLVVAGVSGEGLELADLRVTFKAKKSDAQTPNTAEIRVYNLSLTTANQVRDEFKTVILQAGYEANFGLVFSGNIKQVRHGRENNTDTYLDIAAGDGDDAYNWAVVNTTLAAGASQGDQIKGAVAPMAEKGVGTGFVADTGGDRLPRGKVMYGMSRDYMRQSAEASGTTWSIQDGKVQVVERTGLLPDEAVVLNSKTGLIGTPEQTNDGIKVRCLLNPLLKIGSKVVINEEDIATAKLPDTSKDAQANKPAKITSDGVYRVLTIEHTGDTRGGDWYSDIVCIGVNESAPEGSKVAKV